MVRFGFALILMMASCALAEAATLPASIPLDPAPAYSAQSGYGFSDGTSASHFAADVSNGNYDVTIALGGARDSDTSVKAEERRLLLSNVRLKAGETRDEKFTVNVRDGQLNLEFLGESRSVRSVAIARNEAAPTIFIAGDSTVCDQGDEPWAGWGQMLPSFFQPGIAVANHAHSGRALKSFIWEHRLDAILKDMKAGDYLFVQFTHNDQKAGTAHVEPFTTFKEQLGIYIKAARDKGATPVLVTSMHRRFFDAEGHVQNTLSDYPEAMRQEAHEQGVALIDLNAQSKVLYEAWGPDNSKKAFVWYPANTYPGQDKPLKDNTHFNNYGAYELARCVVTEIQKSDLNLKRFLLPSAQLPFDASHPDSVEEISIASSSASSTQKPEGN